MSREQFNVESPAFHQDDDSHPHDTYTAEDEQRMFDLWCAREAAALVNDLPALRPVTATCREVPAVVMGDLAGAFDRPARTVAEQVADSVKAM